MYVATPPPDPRAAQAVVDRASATLRGPAQKVDRANPANLAPRQYRRLLLRVIVWGGLAMLADALFLSLFRVAESTERFKLPPSNAPNTSFLTTVKALLATAVPTLTWCPSPRT